jgi:chromosome segregation ATPase
VNVARTNLTKSETSIEILKKEAADLQQAANALSTKWKQLDQQAKNKIKERDQMAQKAKLLAQKQIKAVEERRKLAAGQQKQTQDHAAANQALVAASRDTTKKRADSNKDPQNAEKKNALTAAEQSEHQQRQIVQQLAERLANHKKLLAAHEESAKKLEAEINRHTAHIKQLTTEHQQLIAQRDQSAKNKDARIAEMKAKQAKVPGIQKQLQPLRQVIQDKEKLAKAAKDELTNAIASQSQFTDRLKRWQAAAINTDLLQAKAELAEFLLLKDEDPSVGPKIIAHQKKCDELAAKYQAAKK